MMRSIAWVLVVVLAMVGIFVACQEDPNVATQGEAIISGFVTDDATLAPLEGVSVQANSVTLGSQSVVTDAQGVYSFTFELDSTASVELVFSKSGYNDKTQTVQIQSSKVVTLNVEIVAKSPIVGGSGDGGSGLAQTIAFLSAEPQEVSVYGVGGLETSILSWEVRDSLGLPIDAAHSVTLTFTVVGGPNGGEYISPMNVTTSAVGQAYTTFNSGIRSGVVQIMAEAMVGSRTITTAPIRIVINAGFPDQAHFTVGPVKHNFPTLHFAFGKRNPISVLVGDKYSNPVVSNTALYFRTSAGVIQATVFTDVDGQGSADLISGNPEPIGPYADPVLDSAYHYVVARTVGEDGANVTDSTLIMWSGYTQIKNVTPLLFDIPNGGSQSISFEVSDYLGHPLSVGTKITVTATVPPPTCDLCEQNQVQSSFGVGSSNSITLDDYIFPGDGITYFAFLLSDGSTNLDQATPVTVSIAVTSENGNVSIGFSGTVH